MKVTIRKKESQHSFPVNVRERILYAGLRDGVELPYECATGTCGSCKAKLLSGDILNLWPDAPGAKNLKSAHGEFLMCQSAATSDCEISYRGKLLTHRDSDILPDTVAGRIGTTKLLTHDVMHFVVALNSPMTFRAGQFVVVRAPGLPGGRAYSMVNYAEKTTTLELIIKRFNGGGFSEWMFSRDRGGIEIEVFGPLGKATLQKNEAKNVLCIAGGSGVAGIMSLLTQATATNYFSSNLGKVFFGVRSERDIFFVDRLQELVGQANGNLNVTIALSEGDLPDAEKTNGHDHGIHYTSGFITSVAMQAMKNNFDNTVAFVAGPPPMVDDALQQLILEAELPMEDVRYDKFG